MTFVFGLVATDGLVICADSLEADGLTKRKVDKIKMQGVSWKEGGWAFAAAGAGPGGKIDKFFSEVRAVIQAQQVNLKKGQLEKVFESTLTRFIANYPDDPFRIILGIAENQFDRVLYRSDDNYLSPVRDHAHVGVGHSLWRFLTEMLYQRGNSVADNIRLAVFIMRQAIKYVDGVDGPIKVASYTYGDKFWRPVSGQEISHIEENFDSDELKATLQSYWRRRNPPTLNDQLHKFGGVRTPGDELTLLDGVKVEELYTAAGRKRSAKIFRRNTDKLQQRGLLERQRRQEAASNVSQSSGGKNRT